MNIATCLLNMVRKIQFFITRKITMVYGMRYRTYVKSPKKFQDAVFWGNGGVISSNNTHKQRVPALFIILIKRYPVL